MSRLDQVSEARMEIAVKAAKRWKDRDGPRNEIRRKLAREGPASVEAPDLVERYMKRASGRRLEKAVNPARLSSGFLAERLLGIDDRRKLPANSEQLMAGKSVARIVIIRGDGFEPQGFGTGFMISPQLLMTNHHVIGTARDAEGVGANFAHDFIEGGGVRRGEIFDLDPDTFFVSDEALDFAVVAVKPKAQSGADLSEFGWHPLIGETGKILIGKSVNIIQHPMGGPKKYATSGNGLVDRLDKYLHYKTDTEPGASGSPALNDFWEIIALHHSAVPLMNGDTILNNKGEPWHPSQGDDAVEWIANEGVRISRIVAHLRSLTMGDDKMDGMRQEVFALGTTASQTDGPQGNVDTPLAETKPVDAARDPGAHTIVYVHGSADVYTGSVVNQGKPVSISGTGSHESVQAPGLLEKKLVFDRHYGRRQGYQTRFLRDFDIDLPSVTTRRENELVKDRHGNSLILDYHHYSLVMNKSWLLQMWSAVNVDYSPEVRWDIKRAEFGSDTWIHDPRISEALQIDNEELYAPAKKFDRGHVVRRVDSAWGVTREEVIFANSDTFHWTNCTPQHEAFNRSNRKGVWGRLENHITREAHAVDNRMVLFSGPVLKKKRAIPHDFGGGRFLVPLDFWKVVVVAEGRRNSSKAVLRAYGFVVEQKTAIDIKGLEKLPTEERFDVGQFEAHQRPLATIQRMSDIVFPDNVLKADVMGEAARDSRLVLDTLEGVKLKP